MNHKPFTFLLLTTLSHCVASHGATTAQLYVDKLNTSGGIGNPASSSAWAIIYDQNNDGNLPGGLTDGTSVTIANASATAAAFGSSTALSVNTLLSSGDRIIAVGTIPVSGILDDLITFDIGTGLNQVASGRKFSLFWFPGLSVGDNFDTTGAYELGGIFEQNPHAPSFSDYGMVVPGDNENGLFLALDSTAGFPESRLVAVAVPEPGSMLLAVFGTVALLSRRRA
ncbi:PEP-CTERM sorting domain-containing protein [Akkermansiaceae bacterium]|nr:PEP-CTERM sorting domain-containing protein [Akkermansiaceae bacterium]